MTTVSIGFQGEPGAFSEQAARELVPGAQTRGCATFDALIAAVNECDIDYALLPIENSIYGAIARSYDLLWAHPALSIIDETSLHVVQNLIGIAGTRLSEVIEVRSHPVALEQCRLFLGNYPAWNRKVVDDTAGAVREIIAGGDSRITAIGSANAAKVYGAEVLASDIQDDTNNYTRFFLISRVPQSRRALGRACVALAFPSRVGSLRDALTVLAEEQLNLRSLVSRPSGEGVFQYRFYCEIENGDLDAINRALTRIEGESRLLGAY